MRLSYLLKYNPLNEKILEFKQKHSKITIENGDIKKNGKKLEQQ